MPLITFKGTANNARDLKGWDKLMQIPNDDTQNYPFCTLKLVAETFENST